MSSGIVLFNRPTEQISCHYLEELTHIDDLNVFDIIQECKTWLNVASNQELNKASYEEIRQSYTAALECARQACDAKLEVLYTVVTHASCYDGHV